MNDLALLRAFEPVLRFTYGELFFPTDVDRYLCSASLWRREPTGELVELVPAGELSPERLANFDEIEPGQTLFLHYIEEPLEGVAYQRWRHREDRPRFQAPGRLARVGLASRLLDGFFSLSLLLRGTVPGGTTGAAAMRYHESMRDQPRYTYYGRVVREGGYIVLQYFFFYVMNDWRSSFYGANDHEADWEQVLIYLAEQPDGPPTPEWVAFAAHDDHGDNLRRRWDDPQITLCGNHPVVFVGAGSHASYFEQGEYLHSVQLAFLAPLFTVLHNVNRFWRNVLRQGDPDTLVKRIEGFLSVPFVDYARGDGLDVGPGGTEEWSPVLITPEMAWVHRYRGLWGYDARDPMAGETAPGGPKFNRNGTVRTSWHNPLGWAGLHKVAPSPLATDVLLTHLEELQSELRNVEAEIAALSVSLPRLELEVRALTLGKQNQRLLRSQTSELREGEDRLNELYRRRVDLTERIEASQNFLAQIRETGNFGDPQSHIEHAHRPQSESVVRQGRLAETWAALSTGLLLLGFVGLLLTGAASWVAVLALVIGMFLLIEAILYRKLERLLLNITVTLAVVSTIVLVYEFAWYVLVGAVVALAGLIITDNIRELRG